MPLTFCGVGALTVLVEPWMTVRVNGAVPLVAPTVSCRPTGLDANVRSTVLGCTLTEVVLVRPPESVAVRRNSRYDGYSWSGAISVPLAMPLSVCIGCSWHTPGDEQWCSTIVQLSADAGKVPCCGSVAWPEKLIVLPTAQVAVAAGPSMLAVGASLPAVIVTVLSLVTPRVSVTRSRAL